MSNPGERQRDFRKLRTPLLTSLRQGDNAYIHCVTGVCRAPIGASLVASLLTNENVEAAMERIDDLRNTQMDKARQRMGGSWLGKLVEEPCPAFEKSDHYIASTVRPTSVVIHAGVEGSPNHPMCKWKKGGEGAPFKKHAVRLETPADAKSFSDTFCRDCLGRLPASKQLAITEVFRL